MSPAGLSDRNTASDSSRPSSRIARAPMMVSPSLVFWRSHGAANAETEFDVPDRNWVSMDSDRENAYAANGLRTPTVSRPNRNAPAQHGKRNCQADIPADRAITSSYFLLSETRVAMAANSATNGTVCCM